MSRKNYNHLSPFYGPSEECVIDGDNQRSLGVLKMQDGVWRFQTGTHGTLRSDSWLDMLAQIVRFAAEHDVVVDYA